MREEYSQKSIPLLQFKFDFVFLIGVSHTVTTLKVNKQVLIL